MMLANSSEGLKTVTQAVTKSTHPGIGPFLARLYTCRGFSRYWNLRKILQGGDNTHTHTHTHVYIYMISIQYLRILTSNKCPITVRQGCS